jgi:tetratricopeptide (TPR) repeat protein
MILLVIACDFSPPVYKKIIKAQEYLAQRRYQDAMDLYEQILEVVPSDEIRSKICYQIGDILSIYLGNHRRAIGYYERIKKLDTGPQWQVRTEERIADIYFNYLKDYEKSIQSYRILTDIRPPLINHNLYLYRLADSYLNQERYEEALRSFEVLFNVPEYQTVALYNIGLARFYRKEWDEALKVWSEYLKLEKRETNITDVKFLMANVYETTERLKEAYNLYRSILGKHSDTEIIQERLTSIYNRRVARKR